jgi:hypothetical protein
VREASRYTSRAIDQVREHENGALGLDLPPTLLVRTDEVINRFLGAQFACEELRRGQIRQAPHGARSHLPLPTLMLAALQVNLAGGRLPATERDGRRYLKIPLDAFPQAT